MSNHLTSHFLKRPPLSYITPLVCETFCLGPVLQSKLDIPRKCSSDPVSAGLASSITTTQLGINLVSQPMFVLSYLGYFSFSLVCLCDVAYLLVQQPYIMCSEDVHILLLRCVTIFGLSLSSATIFLTVVRPSEINSNGSPADPLADAYWCMEGRAAHTGFPTHAHTFSCIQTQTQHNAEGW